MLERCANPTGSKEGIRISADGEIRMELYKALREIMDLAKQIDDQDELMSEKEMK